ncbi:MAG: glycosyltransferase family 39 protein [Aggregatilineales bacterium]
MPDWLNATLSAFPPLLWMIFGLGLPWTLVILPRRDWRDTGMVACCALAFGAAILTAWMFVLGTLGMNDDPNAGATLNPMQTNINAHIGGQALLTPPNILLGTLILAIIGGLLVWQKWRVTVDESPRERTPFFTDEKLLIALIVIATLARWILTSYLRFGSWDPMWVYAYQGKIYTLIGYIPADIGYYPQFLPLQYAYTQIMAGGINDHTARAVLPFLQVGSIFAAYVLGSRLFTRRIGIITAALWALYPHFGYWTRIGDLEITLAFAFTGTAAFFLMAWTTYVDQPFYRRRYALIAGLFFGVAMWTKPTAGAFIWGVALVVIVEILVTLRKYVGNHNEQKKGDLTGRPYKDHNSKGAETPPRPLWERGLGGEGTNTLLTPRIEVAILTGIACIPLGALWYARNWLIGLDPIVFPPGVWLTRAERSGVEFGWILLALTVLVGFLYLAPLKSRPRIPFVALAILLIALGVAPSILNPHRMIWWEWLAFSAGWIVLGIELWRYGRETLNATGWKYASMLMWAGLIALPYFVTWFYSYSYHYRLAFAIVPILTLPTALILGNWLTVERVSGWKFPVRGVYLLVIFAIALPGTAIAIYDESTGWDWLTQTDDIASQEGAAITRTVRLIEQYIATHDDPPIIVAPGVQRLPFFFPTLDIRVAEAVRTYDSVANADLFIDGADGITIYTGDGSIAPFQNQLLAGLRRDRLATLLDAFQDTTFFYQVYDLHLEDRFNRPDVAIEPESDIVAGDFARFVGYTVSDRTLSATNDMTLQLVWQVTGTTTRDFTTFVHLIDPEQGEDVVLTGWDAPVGMWDRGYYSTRFWDAGEYVVDTRTLRLPDGISAGDYRIRIGFYDESGRADITENGEIAGDGFYLESVFTVGE